jgi:molybdopterin-guanine dinucleotide biosynthesis protein A
MIAAAAGHRLEAPDRKSADVKSIMAADTAGYVLVGGRSSRFGSNKAFFSWQGRPLALRVAEQVRQAAGSVVLIGDPETYRPLGLPVIPDPVSGAGPLAGLAAALGHSSAAWNLVVACDMPHLRADFLEFLLSLAFRRAGDCDALVPVDQAGRPEPLCAVYAKRCHPAIQEALLGGVRKITGAFRNLRVYETPYADWAAYDAGGLLFANVNTRADLDAAHAAP